MARKAIAMRPEARDAASILGALVLERRRALRMTVAELAARASVSPRTVSLIERGDPNVSIGNALNVAATIGVPLFGSADKRMLALIEDAARARVSAIHRVRHRRTEFIRDDEVNF